MYVDCVLSVNKMKMKAQSSSSSNGSRVHKNGGEEGATWIIIAAGALLSTLSIRLGYKLKQAIDSKPPPPNLKGIIHWTVCNVFLFFI